MQLLTFLNSLLWQWILPVLLTIAALLCGWRQAWQPLRGFFQMLHDTYGTLLLHRDAKQKRIFASALAATMGTGNLIGTALALQAGGAGALFWMWISALLGMLLVYTENRLGMQYKRKATDGSILGGALAYLSSGMPNGAAVHCFAFCCCISALGMGNMVQSNTIAQTVRSYNIPPVLCGLVIALLLFLVLKKGNNGIQHCASWLMPLLCGGYLLCCGVLLLQHAGYILPVLRQIVREAFGFRAIGSGFTASVLLQSMSTGLRRGIFSNEAGLGSSALLHMDSDIAQPELQGKWAAAEVFADTVICCTATALVILTTPGCDLSGSTTALLIRSFSLGSQHFSQLFLTICLVTLAFATMIGWYPCGAASARFLFGSHAESIFLFVYILAAFAGAFGSPAALWAFCDCCNGCMALPNIYGMLRHVLCDKPEQKTAMPYRDDIAKI